MAILHADTEFAPSQYCAATIDNRSQRERMARKRRARLAPVLRLRIWWLGVRIKLAEEDLAAFEAMGIYGTKSLAEWRRQVGIMRAHQLILMAVIE